MGAPKLTNCTVKSEYFLEKGKSVLIIPRRSKVFQKAERNRVVGCDEMVKERGYQKV